MRTSFLALGLVISGCASTFEEPPQTVISEPLVTGAQAYFDTYPGKLFFVAEELCDQPGQSVFAPNPNEVRCESLPSPESAAALILRFDGTVENVPIQVLSFLGRETSEGYLVTVDTHIRVATRSGEVQQIRFDDAYSRAEWAELLRAAGGRPLSIR